MRDIISKCCASSLSCLEAGLMLKFIPLVDGLTLL